MKRISRRARPAHRHVAGRARRDGWQFGVLYPSAEPLGEGIVSASPIEVMAAMEAVPPDLDWTYAAPRVVPLLERARPYPPGTPARAQALVPPGLTIGFGIDFGPGHINVSTAMLADWRLSPADLAAHALANLHVLAAQVRSDQVIGGTSTADSAWLQSGQGIGSALPLAPTELARIFGAVPRLFIGPMRDLLIGLPPDIDRYSAAWLYADIANRDPNCLLPRAYRFNGEQVWIEPILALPDVA